MTSVQKSIDPVTNRVQNLECTVYKYINSLCLQIFFFHDEFIYLKVLFHNNYEYLASDLIMILYRTVIYHPVREEGGNLTKIQHKSYFDFHIHNCFKFHFPKKLNHFIYRKKFMAVSVRSLFSKFPIFIPQISPLLASGRTQIDKKI